MSESFKNTYRSNVKDFSRTCIVTFSMLIVFIINLAKRSLQIDLNKFIKRIGLPRISKQLFSIARRKIMPSAFIRLTKELIHEFYNDNVFPTFLGFRIVVVDGSTVQLPEGALIREKYGFCGNAEKSDLMSMARISSAYDPLSGLTLDAIMSPYVASERSMAFDHILNIEPSNSASDLYLFDRGYPSITLIFFLLHHKKEFLIRCSETSWLSEITKLVNLNKKDTIIEICPKILKGKKRQNFQERLPNTCLKSTVKVRVLIINLPNGKREILVTSLLDKKAYNYEIFQGLYHLRWGGEENYKFHKVRIEIENFSGSLPCAIEQDFRASIFTGNVKALIAGEAQEELEMESLKKKNKHCYKINQNIAIGILKDELIDVLLNPKVDLKSFCEETKNEMKKNTESIRPGRSYERIRKTNRKYPMNMRRAF